MVEVVGGAGRGVTPKRNVLEEASGTDRLQDGRGVGAKGFSVRRESSGDGVGDVECAGDGTLC